MIKKAVDDMDFVDVSKKDLADIYRFWSSLVDYKNGGFYGRVDFDLNVHKDAEKGVILNSRILYFFSVYAYINKSEEAKKLAKHAFEFLKLAYDHKNGGLYWSLDYKGKPLDTTKHTYNQAFGVYALSYYYLLTEDKEAKEYAYALFDVIENKCREADSNHYYIEAQKENFVIEENDKLSENGVIATRTMNTLLHLLEAYTALYHVFGTQKYKESLEKIVKMFIRDIYDSKNKSLKVFFDKDYKSIIDLESYGHEIETSWLLTEAVDLLDDKSLKAEVDEISISLANSVLNRAYKPPFILNECDKGVVDDTRVWWIQAEGVNGYINAYQLTKNKEYLDIAEVLLNGIQKYFIDKRTNSEWFWDLSNDNLPTSKRDIVEPWKCPYHNGRMCFEILKRM
ncbi:MAG: AGE family epimerase/isomerase [Bacilli bacterium]